MDYLCVGVMCCRREWKKHIWSEARSADYHYRSPVITFTKRHTARSTEFQETATLNIISAKHAGVNAHKLYLSIKITVVFTWICTRIHSLHPAVTATVTAKIHLAAFVTSYTNEAYLPTASHRAVADYVFGRFCPCVCLCAISVCKQDISKTNLWISAKFTVDTPYTLAWDIYSFTEFCSYLN